MVMEPTKVCTVCLERKPWSAFYKTRTGNPRWACKPCERRIAAERLRHKRQQDPERVRAQQRAGYHRRKADPEWLGARRDYQRANMNRYRRARGIPEGTKRGAMQSDMAARVLLDPAPFVAWVEGVMARDGLTIIDAAFRLGCSERRLRDILHGRTGGVDLVTVERALIADGTTMLDNLYPLEMAA